MKRLPLKTLVIGLVVMSFAFLGMVTPSAALAGGIVSVHGHHGNIEYQDRVISSRQFLGWGLDFTQASGNYNWIHYSIPTPLFTNTRYLAIQFLTGSVDVEITKFHVYDGAHKIFSLEGLDLAGNTHQENWFIIDMGSDKLITRALGLSIEIGAGVEMMSHQVAIYAVGAEWH